MSGFTSLQSNNCFLAISLVVLIFLATGCSTLNSSTQCSACSKSEFVFSASYMTKGELPTVTTLKINEWNRLFLGGAGFRWVWAAQVSEDDVNNIMRLLPDNLQEHEVEKGKYYEPAVLIIEYDNQRTDIAMGSSTPEELIPFIKELNRIFSREFEEHFDVIPLSN